MFSCTFLSVQFSSMILDRNFYTLHGYVAHTTQMNAFTKYGNFGLGLVYSGVGVHNLLSKDLTACGFGVGLLKRKLCKF